MYSILFFLLIVAIIFIIYEKNIINPVVVFSLIWIISIFLSSLRLFGMIEISSKALNLIMSGVTSFIAGAIIVYIYEKKRKKEKKNKNIVYEDIIDYNVINTLLIIGIVFVAFLAAKVTTKIITGVRYSDIRAMYYSYGNKEPLIKSEMLFTIFDWTCSIILTSITPIVIIGITRKKKNTISTILLTVFTLLYIYSTAGRSQLFVVAIETILISLLNKDDINKRIIKNATKIIGIIFLTIIMLSVARRNSKDNSVNQLYAYFSLPTPYFSELINYADKQKISTNGIATFYGPYLLAQKAIKGLTGYKLKYATYFFDIINKPQNYWIKIFKNSPDYYNAYGTMFYNFYIDGGIVGIIIFSMLYGAFMEKIYLEAKSKKSIFKQALYLIFMIGLCNSFIRWHFASATIFISLILVRIIIKKRKKDNYLEKENKVLVFGITENPGGVESVIMNYYRNINKDKVKFDFLCNTEKVAYEEEIRELGGRVFRITPRSKNRIKFKNDMKNFFKDNAWQYSAIWVNVCSLANIDYLKYAQKYGIERRIIHCHNSQNMDSFIRGMLHKWNKILLKYYATDFWSCDSEASKWFYNKRIIESNRYHIIKNAIDYNKFAFDEKIRAEYKEKLNLSNKIVLGNIGRLHFQKNQMFLIDVFYHLHRLNNEFKLVLVGDGEDREKIKEKIVSLNLENDILLLGIRNDVNNVLQMMDALVFPSLFEGLPLVLVEAQANGLPIFASDGITEKIKMSENLKFISLKKDAQEWANIIWQNYSKCNFKRIDNYNNIVTNGYEINNEVKKLEKYFERI